MLLCFNLLLLFVLGAVSGRIDDKEYDPDYKRFVLRKKGNEGNLFEIVDLKTKVVTNNKFPLSMSHVTYDFYTKPTQYSPLHITNNNVDVLSDSNFDPSTPIVFVIRGLQNGATDRVNTEILKSIFINHDCNLFTVNWSKTAKHSYAETAAKAVGKVIANFINSIQTEYDLSGSSFTLIGHGLGAHVAGIIGSKVNSKLSHIIGLDPIGHLSRLDPIVDRLDSTDAEFVQVIHTSGDIVGMGITSSIGHVDFWPNGGSEQPGCGPDFFESCAHLRAVYYFAEALSRNNAFRAVKCKNYSRFKKRACKKNKRLAMGQLFPKSK